MVRRSFLLLLVFIVALAPVFAGNIKVGVGRKIITPKEPAYMNGYASPNRLQPANGVEHDLWAKALAFEDEKGYKFIIVTLDILGVSREISIDVFNKLQKKYGIQRSQLLLNSSHTHSGPMIWPAAGMFDYATPEMKIVYEYALQLTEDIVAVVDIAMGNMAPAELASGHGNATFAINRRDPKIITRPVDYDVPVLKISTLQGELKAVLFGYACHNTTLGGTYQKINGDYAGYAQIALEKAHPGVTALFFQGCCGDINPDPRGTQELAAQHGKTLADVVGTVLQGKLNPVDGAIQSNYATADLEFLPFDPAKYQREMLSEDAYLQRRAKLMLQAYNKGWDVSKYAYPLQSVRFGKSLTILALAGEIVVDYSLWAKQQFKKENLFVAGYSNEVMCYIPTKRILGEGGYEPESSMIYYVLPGPFKDDVEERIRRAIKRVMK